MNAMWIDPATGDIYITIVGSFNLGGLCLLYTSDAADERSSVDLGGRRIIKKKNKKQRTGRRARYKHAERVAEREKAEQRDESEESAE